jgi:tetratricopeptide (TPR) repeat protein
MRFNQFQCLIAAILFVALYGSGCATPSRHALPAGGALSAGEASRRASMALADIQPQPVLPTTRHSAPELPSSEALALFAQAQRELIDNQSYSAIQLLQKTIALDPLSPAPYRLLAEAQLGNANFNDKSIQALQTATQLDPQDIEAQVELGRQYLAKGDTAAAIARLRLALQTPAYTHQQDEAAIADLFLARALQEGEYDRAAIDQYEILLSRLRAGSLSVRRNPQLSALIGDPDLISVQIGKLHRKHGQYAQALEALEPVADRQPTDFKLQAAVARLMVKVNRIDDAITLATQLVSGFHANKDSIELLQEICENQPAGRDAISQLRDLHQSRPKDRAILFALSDALRAAGNTKEARDILVSAMGEQSANIEIARRLVATSHTQNELRSAANVLIETLTRDPDADGELVSLWNDLTSLTRPGRLKQSDIDAISVSHEEDAAKLYFIAQTAYRFNHLQQAIATLDKAMEQSPLFAPAYRFRQSLNWDDPAATNAQKAAADQVLVARATAGGDAALAGELQALSLIRQKDYAAAVDRLTKALSQESVSPDGIIQTAAAQDELGHHRQAEQLLWKLVSDHPACELAFNALFTHYLGRSQIGSAIKVLSIWLATDPGSIKARILQITVNIQSGQPDVSRLLLSKLVDEHPDDPNVLPTAYFFYGQLNATDDFITHLEEAFSANPQNRAAAEVLIEGYFLQNRTADAGRVLSALVASADKDTADGAELLYHYATLYAQIGQPKQAEHLLTQALAVDSKNASVCNDLGYTWADSGRNLEKAQNLIQIAVAAEPQNLAYRDSMGWVLYKRGKFEDARDDLLKAVVSATPVDPTVYDHLGDAQYQLKQTHQARDAWQKALDGINAQESPRSELNALKLRLMQKIKQLDASQPVSVAGTVGNKQ